MTTQTQERPAQQIDAVSAHRGAVVALLRDVREWLTSHGMDEHDARTMCADVVRECLDTTDTITVRVRDHSAESPWGHGLTNPQVRRVTISAYCQALECGGRRGEPRNLNTCDDGAHYSVDVWDNPCGHVDSYEAVVVEARKLAEVSGV